MCLVVEWPAREAAVLMLAPFAMIFVIKEWRAQWKVICFRILASITHLRRILIVYEFNIAIFACLYNTFDNIKEILS